MTLRPNRDVSDAPINLHQLRHAPGHYHSLIPALICHRGQQYNLFLEGLVPPALACSDQVDRERQAIISAMGLKAHATPLEFMTAPIHPEETPELDVFRTLAGPYTIDHRYLTEDALCCGAFCVSVGRRLGLEAPLLTAFLTIAGVLTGQGLSEKRPHPGKPGLCAPAVLCGNCRVPVRKGGDFHDAQGCGDRLRLRRLPWGEGPAGGGLDR